MPMDRLSIISGALFFTADIFAVMSLAMPNWIVSDIGGKHIKTKVKVEFLELISKQIK